MSWISVDSFKRHSLTAGLHSASVMCHLAAIDWCLLVNFKLATAKKREGFPPRRHLITCTTDRQLSSARTHESQTYVFPTEHSNTPTEHGNTVRLGCYRVRLGTTYSNSLKYEYSKNPSSILSHHTTKNKEMNIATTTTTIAQMTDQDLVDVETHSRTCERFGEYMKAPGNERDRKFSSSERVVLENLGRPDCEIKEESRTVWNGLYIARIDAEGDEEAGKF